MYILKNLRRNKLLWTKSADVVVHGASIIFEI